MKNDGDCETFYRAAPYNTYTQKMIRKRSFFLYEVYKTVRLQALIYK